MVSVRAVFLFCAILGGLADRSTTQTTTVDPNCGESWNVIVTPDIVVRWSGVNRTADVEIEVVAVDFPVSGKCLKKLISRADFNNYELNIPKTPCKGISYEVKAKLICDNNIINESNIVVSIPPYDLTAVENVRTVNVTDTVIELVWDAIHIQGRLDISYFVQWRELDAYSYEEQSTNVSSCKLRDLNPYTNYSIQVRAHNGLETGNWSEVLVVRTNPGPPAEPQNVTTISDSTSVLVNWEEPTPFRGPIILYSVIWRNNTTRIYNRDNTSDLSYTIQNLTPLTAYFIRVRAATEAGLGNKTQIVFVRTKRPVPPENLRETAITSDSVEVAWDEPKLYVGKGWIVAYSVEWTMLNSKESQSRNTTDLTFVISDLDPLTNYSVQVGAWTENGIGEWTQPLIVQTEIGVPWPPENIREGRVTDTSIEVFWEVSKKSQPPVTVNDIRWRKSDTYYEKWETKDTNGSHYVLESLDPFTNYTIQVRSWTRFGPGNWTDPIVVRTAIGVPSIPRNITVVGQQTSLEIWWEEPQPYRGPITSYSVQWGEVDSYHTIRNVSSETNYVIRELNSYTLYWVQVSASSYAGASDWSPRVEARTAVGIPSIPRNLKEKDSTKTTIEVQWEEPRPTNGPIISYTVRWKNMNNDLVLNVTTNALSYLMSDLDPFTNYSIEVRATTEAGYGGWSDSLVIRTNIGVPSIPMNLTETNTTSTTIEIRWEEPRSSNGPIISYTVRWTNLNNDFALNRTTKAPSYLIKGLNPFTNYSIEVRATTEAGYGGWSDSVVIRTDIGVPSKPTGLGARGITSTSLSLVWKEPEPVVGPIIQYVLQWKNMNTDKLKGRKTTNTFSIVKDLDPYTNYMVMVRAATSAGQGDWSDSQLFRTLSGVPEPPLNVSVSSTNQTIHVKWEEPKPFKGPVTSYSVRWMHSVTRQNWTQTIYSLEYKITKLDPYTSYHIAVKAKTDAGFGPWSDDITVRTAIGIPTVPQNISLRNKTAWRMEITWLAPDPTNGPLVNYEVVWGILGGQTSSNLTNNTYFEVEKLVPYTEYSFQVSASTVAGYGPQSQPLVERTGIAIPSKPLDLMLVSSTNISLSVKWKEPSPSNGPILGYSVQWGRVKDEARVMDKNTSYCLIDDLDPYTNYSIQISARTVAGSGPWTDPLVADTQIGVPKPAQLLSVEVESSRTIVVEWETSNPYPGPTNYSLEVWRKPGQCENAKKDICESTMKGNKGPDEWDIRRQEMIENLLPYTQYYVRILLATPVAGSESVNSTSVRTLPESPEAPTEVQADCRLNSTEVEVRWKPPARANGKIIEYLVKYGVEFSGWNEKTIPASSQCKEHRIQLHGLRPERNYKIRVQARAEGISKIGEEGYMRADCVLPAGVPPIGNVQNMKAEGSGSYHLVFEWSRDVFSDNMGSLVNYAILVGLPEAVGNATNGRLAEQFPSWANFSVGMTSFYQATPLEWNPFEKEKNDPLNCEEFRTDDGVEIRTILRCIVGVKSQCSNEEPYCNGPLRPDTTYGLKIRAFTRGGYAETEPIYASTGPVPGSSLVGGLVGGFICLLLLSAFIFGTFILKRKGKLEELRLGILSRIRVHVPASAPQAPPGQVLQLEPYPTIAPLTDQNFAEHVRIMMSDSHLRFSQEFEALKRNSPKFPCLTAEMEENRSKNRWLNIFPYDHSRVKLLPLGDEPASDFVNANYIPGYSSLREYIASQGPLNATVEDMWRMVWEQSTTMIVMLTQCVERGKNKCEQYWPSPAGEATHYGDIQVRALSESMLSSYVIRVFHVQLGSQERMVKQMHFTHWPDFGCPESPDDLINFVRAVRDHLPRIRPGPILVHCSAGVGRTGTFIAVDRLSQQLRYTDVIDIYGTVMELRHHRINMVQTEDQYIYIHLCVKQLLEEMNQPPESEYEEAIYSNISMEKDTGF